MSGIGIIATLRVQLGKEAEFEGVFAELAPAVAANEPGNSYYKLFRTEEAGCTRSWNVMTTAPRSRRTAPRTISALSAPSSAPAWPERPRSRS